MANANDSRLFLSGGITANIAIAVSKLITAYFTDSSTMLSEGIHSLVDTGNGGLLLMLVAVLLVGRTKDLPVGTSVHAATLANFERIVREQPQVRKIRSPLTMYLGPNDVMLALDVDFADDLTSVQMAINVERLQDTIRVAHPEVQRIFSRRKT